MYLVIRRFIQRFSLSCGALVLSACTTLGPDYREPEVSWLKDWQASAYPPGTPAEHQAEHQKTDDLQFWLQLFNDPVLTELIEVVKRDNLSLRIAGSGLYPQL